MNQIICYHNHLNSLNKTKIYATNKNLRIKLFLFLVMPFWILQSIGCVSTKVYDIRSSIKPIYFGNGVKIVSLIDSNRISSSRIKSSITSRSGITVEANNLKYIVSMTKFIHNNKMEIASTYRSIDKFSFSINHYRALYGTNLNKNTFDISRDLNQLIDDANADGIVNLQIEDASFYAVNLFNFLISSTLAIGTYIYLAPELQSFLERVLDYTLSLTVAYCTIGLLPTAQGLIISGEIVKFELE